MAFRSSSIKTEKRIAQGLLALGRFTLRLNQLFPIYFDLMQIISTNLKHEFTNNPNYGASYSKLISALIKV